MLLTCKTQNCQQFRNSRCSSSFIFYFQTPKQWHVKTDCMQFCHSCRIFRRKWSLPQYRTKEVYVTIKALQLELETGWIECLVEGSNRALFVNSKTEKLPRSVQRNWFITAFWFIDDLSYNRRCKSDANAYALQHCKFKETIKAAHKQIIANKDIQDLGAIFVSIIEWIVAIACHTWQIQKDSTQGKKRSALQTHFYCYPVKKIFWTL